MNVHHLRALVALDIRRMGPVVLRVQAAALALAVLFVFFSSTPVENVLAVLVGTPLGVTLLAPVTVVRDKMEGTLEFLCNLPATATELVTARFVTAALSLLPSIAFAVLGVGAATLPAPFADMRGVLVIGILAGVWPALTIVAWLLTAAFASFEFAHLLRWPLLIVALLVVVLPRIMERVPADRFVDLLRVDADLVWVQSALALSLFGGMAAVGALAFAITRRAFATYRPNFEQPL